MVQLNTEIFESLDILKVAFFFGFFNYFFVILARSVRRNLIFTDDLNLSVVTLAVSQ